MILRRLRGLGVLDRALLWRSISKRLASAEAQPNLKVEPAVATDTLPLPTHLQSAAPEASVTEEEIPEADNPPEVPVSASPEMKPDAAPKGNDVPSPSALPLDDLAPDSAYETHANTENGQQAAGDEALNAAVGLCDDLLQCRSSVLKTFSRTRGVQSTTRMQIILDLIDRAKEGLDTAKQYASTKKVFGERFAQEMAEPVSSSSSWTNDGLEASQLENACQRLLSGGDSSTLQARVRKHARSSGWIMLRLLRVFQEDYEAVAAAAVGGVYRTYKEEAQNILAHFNQLELLSAFAAFLQTEVTCSYSSNLTQHSAVIETLIERGVVRPTVDEGDFATLEKMMGLLEYVAADVETKDTIAFVNPFRSGSSAEVILQTLEPFGKRHKDWELEDAPQWVVDMAAQFTHWESVVRNDIAELHKAPREVFDAILINVAALRILHVLYGDGGDGRKDVPTQYRQAFRMALQRWVGDHDTDGILLKLNNYTQISESERRHTTVSPELFEAIFAQMQSTVPDDSSHPPNERVALLLREIAASATRAERCAGLFDLMVTLTDSVRFHLRFSEIFKHMTTRDRKMIRTNTRVSMSKTLAYFEKDLGITPPTVKSVAFLTTILLYLCTRSSAQTTPLLHRYVSCTGKEELSIVAIGTRVEKHVSDVRVALPPQLTYRSWLDTEKRKSIYRVLQADAVKGATNNIMLISQAPMIKALDAISKVPWRISKYMLYVQEAMVQAGYPFGKIRAAFYPLHYAQMQDGVIDTSMELEHKLCCLPVSAKYREQFEHDWRDLQDLRSSRVHYLQALRQARALMDMPEVYFPHSLDFRGRMYPLPGRLNHTGSDPFRALLEHAEPKELTEEGLFWLKVHLANKMGQNKLTFEERVQYVDEHINDVVQSAEAPLHGDRWWQEGAEPLQALMACKELCDALKFSQGPAKFPSRLPVAVDGSYNGLQHYSAIGRDEIGGKLVNLIPSERPSDAYTGILNEMMKSIKADAEKDNEVAQRCIGTGRGVNKNHIKRKTIKRPIMTQVYGVTAFGMVEQIRDELVAQNKYHGLWTSTDIKEMATYIKDKLLESLGITFKETQQCRLWLSNVANLIWACQPSETRSAFSWTTPLGLIVRQPYRKGREFNLFTPYGFTKIQGTTIEPANRKQLSALAPNLIHSLDATHLAMTAIEMQKQGLTMMAVHDSFWTYACDLPQLSRVLREQFVALYEHYDPLWELKEQWEELFYFDLRRHGVRLPDPPQRGKLVLREVLNSKFFFS